MLGDLTTSSARGSRSSSTRPARGSTELTAALTERSGRDTWRTSGVHVELFDSGQTMIKGSVEDTEVEIEFNVELRPSNFFDEARPWRPGEPPRHMGTGPWDVEGEVLVMRVAKVAGRKYTIQETAADLEESRHDSPEAAVTAFAKYVDDLVELARTSREPTTRGLAVGRRPRTARRRCAPDREPPAERSRLRSSARASSSPRPTRSSRARLGSPLSARASTGVVATRPPKSTHGTSRFAAVAEHGAGRLALERRLVDRALAGDGEARVTRALVEARQLQHDLGALLELAAERRERRAEPAARAGAGGAAVRRELLHRGEAVLELVDRLGARALLRAEHARGAARAEQRVAHVAQHAQRHALGPARQRRDAGRAPPSTVAVPPTQTSTAAGPVTSTATSSSPSPALEATSGSRSSPASNPSPTASADSTTAVRSGSSSQRAVTGRPSGSDAGASATRRRASAPARRPCPRRRRRPAARRTSSRRLAARPRPARPRRRRGERTPLRLAGHASARRPRLQCLLDGRLVELRVAGRLGHPLERGVREALARQEDEADADAHRRLDRLQPEPEREAARVGHAVLPQRERDRRLDEADVPRPEREDDRDVHQHQHEPRGRRAARRCRTPASSPTPRTSWNSQPRNW